MVPEQCIDTIARACHEANRVWCLAHGDNSQKSWEEEEEWQKESARNGISVALAGASPQEQHGAWMQAKLADGWVHGPEGCSLQDPSMSRPVRGASF